jgi:hypothetical protein
MRKIVIGSLLYLAGLLGGSYFMFYIEDACTVSMYMVSMMICGAGIMLIHIGRQKEEQE